MNGLCNLKNAVYQPIIFLKEYIKDKNSYMGISSVTWKLVYNNHNYSFSHERLSNQTVLSKHFSKLKNNSLTPEIQQRI